MDLYHVDNYGMKRDEEAETLVNCGGDLKVRYHPFACIQTLWLKTKSIAWVMSVTGLAKW